MLSDSGFSLNFDNDIDKYQEIKRKIIENIKKNASEWKFQELLNSKRWVSDYLVHQSFNYNYDEEGFLVVEYGKIHWKRGFSEEERKEIVQSINNPPLINSSNLLESAIGNDKIQSSLLNNSVLTNSSNSDAEIQIRERNKAEALRRLEEFKKSQQTTCSYVLEKIFF